MLLFDVTCMCVQAAAMNTNTLTAIKNMPFLNTVEWGIFDSSKQNSDVSSSSSSSSYPSDSIPFQSSAGDSRASPQLTSVTDLTRSLKDHLPSTIIRVFRVPHVSSRK